MAMCKIHIIIYWNLCNHTKFKNSISSCIKLFPCVGRLIESNPVVHRRDFVFGKFI